MLSNQFFWTDRSIKLLERFKILKDDIFFEYTMAISTRGWPLMERFNEVALHSMQHGLYEHWETEVGKITKNEKREKNVIKWPTNHTFAANRRLS